MTDYLISPIQRFSMGVADYVKRIPRDGHEMNSTAPGLKHWREGWDAAAAADEQHKMVQRRKVQP